MSFINLYKSSYTQKFYGTIERLRKLDGGLSKLKEAAQRVADMKDELNNKEEILAVYTEEANAVLRRVRKKNKNFI